MNNDLVAIQNEKVKFARREGDIACALKECFEENGSIIDRQQALKHVSNHIGLSDSEAKAKHIPKNSDIPKNFLESAVDYTLTDMKNGKFGSEYTIQYEEGCWIFHNCNTSSSKLKEIAKLHGITSKKERKEFARQEIWNYFKSLSKKKKKLFKENGGNMSTTLSLVLLKKCTVEEAINYFLT